jgi:hypothetical protein
MNENIKKYLDHYLSIKSPEFAILLNGKWGSGKTYFIQEYIKENKSNYKFIYVTLNGVMSSREINDDILVQLYPIRHGKYAKTATKLITGLIKASIKFDFNQDGETDGNIAISIPDSTINEQDDIKAANTVFIFDDLERCAMPLKNVMGHIQYFVEQTKHNVIILCNEEKMSKRYYTIKEKLVGNTFKLQPCFNEAIDSFIDNGNTTSKQHLTQNSALIKTIFKESKYDNLRNIKQAIFDFSNFIHQAKLVFERNNPEAIEYLIKTYFIFYIEHLNNKKFINELKNINSQYVQIILFSQKNVQKMLLIELTKKYSNFDISETVLGDSWYNYFLNRQINAEELKESLTTSRFFRNNITDAWKTLLHLYDLNADEFEDAYNRFENDLATFAYKNVGLIKHAIGIQLFLIKLKVINKKEKDVYDYFINYAKHVIDNNTIDFHSTWLDFFTDESFQSYTYASNENKYFIMFNKEFRQLYTDKFKQLLDNEEKELNKLTIDNHGEFLEILTNENPNTKYYNLPILVKISPEIFTGFFLNHSELKKEILYALSSRYKNPNSGLFKEEQEALNSIKQKASELKNGNSFKSFLLTALENRIGHIIGINTDK